MADTIKRVVAEAMLARRFETEIHEGASKADIPTLEENVEKHTQLTLALDTDGVPYIANGEL